MFVVFSSRSHLMLTLSLEGVDSVSKAVTRGKLMLVDLAGSERISRSEATGQRLVEAAAINKSLSALGQVIGIRLCATLSSQYDHISVAGIHGSSHKCSAHSLSQLKAYPFTAACFRR